SSDLPDHPRGDEGHVHRQRDAAEQQRRAHGAAAPLRKLVVGTVGAVHHQHAQWLTSPCARSPSRMTGGVAKVWGGAGDGTVHSSQRADSQARAGAMAPFFSEWNRMPNIRKGVANMPNAPIELTRFQSANTTL